MPTHDIIVIGASAGGVEALSKLVSLLPANLPASLFVVMHFPAQGTSILPQILNRYTTLPAHHALDQEPIQPGQIYVVPPNCHLLLRPGYVYLSRGPREHGHRPSIDALFRSAARAYGSRVVGIILSGTMDDGSAGVIVIKDRGGITMVQDPKEALFSGMPRSAIETTKVDHILTLTEIASQLTRLANQAVPQAANQAVNQTGYQTGHQTGYQTGYQTIREGEMMSHEMEQEREVVADDKASRMETRARRQNLAKSATQFANRAVESEQHADLVRQMILQPLEAEDGNQTAGGDLS